MKEFIEKENNRRNLRTNQESIENLNVEEQFDNQNYSTVHNANEFTKLFFDTTAQGFFQKYKNVPCKATYKDNLIIVDMLPTSSNGAMESIESTVTGDKHFGSAAAIQSTNQGFCKYLKCKQNCSSKITPIVEESQDDLDQCNTRSTSTSAKEKANVGCCLNMKSCWPPWPSNDAQDIEMYDSRTTIRRRENIKRKTDDSVPLEVKHQEVQTISSGTFQGYTQYKNIHLNHYGTLINCDGVNSSDLDEHRVKWLRNESLKSKKKKKSSTVRNWLMGPFHGKYRKPQRTSHIQAVVYKTYFVKWGRPPDCPNNGFSVKRYSPTGSPNTMAPTLKRSRSATF